jgi:hypothetical protein
LAFWTATKSHGRPPHKLPALIQDRPRGYDLAPGGYLRVVLAVARVSRRGEYVLVHFGAGSFLRTDRLGALAVRALVAGRSGAEAMQLAEKVEPGAGERVRHLICLLGATGAMTLEPPVGIQGRLRFAASSAAGFALSAMSVPVRLVPMAFLAWIFKIWPWTPIPRYVWRCGRLTILNNLNSGGFSTRDKRWSLQTGRRSAAEPSRNYLFNYLSVTLAPKQLSRLVDRLFDRDSADDLANRVRSTGPVVGVFLHGPLFVPIPHMLRNRGLEVVRVVVPRTHGLNVSESSGPLGRFFGESTGDSVEETDPNSSIALLRHLKAGRNVYVALDKLLGEATKLITAEIEWLGHCVARNDGPAWLAVRSGRPLILWTAHNSPSGVVITASPHLYPDSSLIAADRVADLSTRLYALAEAAIRERPEAWACWTYPSIFAPQPSLRGGHVDRLRALPKPLP